MNSRRDCEPEEEEVFWWTRNWLKRRKKQKRHHRHRGLRLWLTLEQGRNKTAILLYPRERAFVMSKLPVDQIVTLGIIAVDSKGNQSPFTPDAPPAWTNSNSAAASSATSADGMTNVVTPGAAAVGLVDTVTVTLDVGGVRFTATVDETIVVGAIVGVRITETFSPAP